MCLRSLSQPALVMDDVVWLFSILQSGHLGFSWSRKCGRNETLIMISLAHYDKRCPLWSDKSLGVWLPMLSELVLWLAWWGVNLPQSCLPLFLTVHYFLNGWAILGWIPRHSTFRDLADAPLQSGLVLAAYKTKSVFPAGYCWSHSGEVPFSTVPPPHLGIKPATSEFQFQLPNHYTALPSSKSWVCLKADTVWGSIKYFTFS